MADLQSALANIPGLAGYLAKKQLNEAAPVQQLQQASGALQLEGAITQQQDQARMRAILESSAPPEAKFNALAKVNPAAAHQYATGLTELGKVNMLGGGGIDFQRALKDPQYATQVQTAFPHVGPELERLRKVEENKAALEALRGPAVEGQPRINPQLAELTKSDVPGIAQRAAALNAGLQAGNIALPASYWQTHIENLAKEHTTALEKRTPQGPLSDMAKLNADLAAGRITKDQFDAAIATKQGSPEAIENTAQLIANRQMPALSGFAMRSPMGAQIMARVKQIDPNYQAGDFQVALQAEKGFTSGKQGNTVRSFNVAINHLGTLDKLADALGNGNVPLINKAAQEVAQQTGAAAPVQFDAAKKIVGDEIVKAIVGSGGGVTDRQEAEKAVSRANSPAQLKGVISTYKELMRGQLNGLQKQYEASTKKKDFEERFLTPEAQGVATHAAPAEAPAAPSGSGWSIKPVGG